MASVLLRLAWKRWADALREGRWQTLLLRCMEELDESDAAYEVDLQRLRRRLKRKLKPVLHSLAGERLPLKVPVPRLPHEHRPPSEI